MRESPRLPLGAIQPSFPEQQQSERDRLTERLIGPQPVTGSGLPKVQGALLGGPGAAAGTGAQSRDAAPQLRGLWVAQGLGEGVGEKSGGSARDGKDNRADTDRSVPFVQSYSGRRRALLGDAQSDFACRPNKRTRKVQPTAAAPFLATPDPAPVRTPGCHTFPTGHPPAPLLTHGRARGAPPAAASGSAGRAGCRHSAAGSGRPPRRAAARAAAAAAARAACREHRASLCRSRPRHAPRSSRPALGRARPSPPGPPAAGSALGGFRGPLSGRGV